MDVVIKRSKMKRRSIGESRVKWWNLIRQNAAKLSERIKAKASWKHVKDANIMWEAMAECIWRSANDALCVSRGGGDRIKGAWWWNEEVQEKVKMKQDAYAALIDSRTDK